MADPGLPEIPEDPMTLDEFARWRPDLPEGAYELIEGHPCLRWEADPDSPTGVAPPAANHNEIALNASIALRRRAPKGCRVLPGSGVSKDADRTNGPIPDIVMVSDRPRENRHYFRNPKIIVEILSPSTRGRDKGVKLDFCKEIETVEAILLIEADRRWVQLSQREDGIWTGRDHISSGVLDISGLNAPLPIDEIYRDLQDETDA